MTTNERSQSVSTRYEAWNGIRVVVDTKPRRVAVHVHAG